MILERGSNRKQAGSKEGLGGPGLGDSPTWGSWLGEKGNEAPPLSAEEKALDSVSSCPPSMEELESISWPHLMAQRLFPVEPLEETFAKFISADHDSTGGGSLDDPREKACKESLGA